METAHDPGNATANQDGEAHFVMKVLLLKLNISCNINVLALVKHTHLNLQADVKYKSMENCLS